MLFAPRSATRSPWRRMRSTSRKRRVAVALAQALEDQDVLPEGASEEPVACHGSAGLSMWSPDAIIRSMRL